MVRSIGQDSAGAVRQRRPASQGIRSGSSGLRNKTKANQSMSDDIGRAVSGLRILPGSMRLKGCRFLQPRALRKWSGGPIDPLPYRMKRSPHSGELA